MQATGEELPKYGGHTKEVETQEDSRGQNREATGKDQGSRNMEATRKDWRGRNTEASKEDQRGRNTEAIKEGRLEEVEISFGKLGTVSSRD